MDTAQNPSNSECHTPQSESFRYYLYSRYGPGIYPSFWCFLAFRIPDDGHSPEPQQFWMSNSCTTRNHQRTPNLYLNQTISALPVKIVNYRKGKKKLVRNKISHWDLQHPKDSTWIVPHEIRHAAVSMCINRDFYIVFLVAFWSIQSRFCAVDLL
jgi:hypothetical protein